MAISFVSISYFIFLTSVRLEIRKELTLKTSVFWTDTS